MYVYKYIIIINKIPLYKHTQVDTRCLHKIEITIIIYNCITIHEYLYYF